MMRHETSLFSRLALRVTLILSFGAALMISAAWYYGRSAANQTFDHLLLGAALQMAGSLSIEDGKLTASLPQSAFEMLGLAPEDRIFYRLIDTEGQTLTGYGDLAGYIDYTAARQKPVFLNDDYRGAPVRLVVVSRVLSDPALSGWAYVLVAQTTAARNELTQEITGRAMLLVALMSGLALGATILAVRSSLQPITALGEMISRRDPQDLTPLTLDAPKELRPFLGSINHFMERLEERVVLLQRFIADAAHQIRTPLTALSAQIDMLDEHEVSPTGMQSVERIRTRTNELSRLTGQLLSHAMVIHRASTVNLEKVDLVLIARQAYRTAIPITVNPDIVVSFEADQPQLWVRGDIVSLREAIVNLISNALCHGSQALLAVRVGVVDGQAQVEVTDDGPGIPPEKWPLVVKRFMTTKPNEGNTGLGFSIAVEVATAHDGTIGFREKQGDGRFSVLLNIPLWQEGQD